MFLQRVPFFEREEVRAVSLHLYSAGRRHIGYADQPWQSKTGVPEETMTINMWNQMYYEAPSEDVHLAGAKTTRNGSWPVLQSLNLKQLFYYGFIEPPSFLVTQTVPDNELSDVVSDDKQAETAGDAVATLPMLWSALGPHMGPHMQATAAEASIIAPADWLKPKV